MSEQQMSDATFGRLFIIMIICMTVLSVLLAVLAVIASNGVNDRLTERSEVENSAAIAERLTPVGNFSSASADGVAAAPQVEVVLTGAEAYASCGACHDAGIAGAPAFGDVAAWTDRVAKGIEALYDNAINGYQGSAGYMPAKGGNLSLSDDSVRAAVDYIVEASQ